MEVKAGRSQSPSQEPLNTSKQKPFIQQELLALNLFPLFICYSKHIWDKVIRRVWGNNREKIFSIDTPTYSREERDMAFLLPRSLIQSYVYIGSQVKKL